MLLLVFAGTLTSGVGRAQQATPPPAPATTPDDAEDVDAPALIVSANTSPEERKKEAWKILSAAAGDKHSHVKIQALAAIGMLNCPEAEKMIADALNDSDVDVRTAAVLAAGQSGDRNLTTQLRNLLDDKHPQVVFTSAMTLWQMGDRSGEDILMSVVDGDRSTSPTLLKGTEHKLNKDLHNPKLLARLGLMQGAAMMLGPFGFGITAYEYIHKSGGNVARVSAIEAIAQDKTEPIHRELMAALTDDDSLVRAASAKALVDYHNDDTSNALYPLLGDPKYPVRLTAAAAYLRTTGTPGPPSVELSGTTQPKGKRKVKTVRTRPIAGSPVPMP